MPASGILQPMRSRWVRRAAASWLQAHPETASLEIRFEVAAVTGGRVERLRFRDG